MGNDAQRKGSPLAEESSQIVRYKRSAKVEFEKEGGEIIKMEDQKKEEEEENENLAGIWDRIGRDMLPIVLKFVFERKEGAKEAWMNLRKVNHEWRKVADSVFPFVEHEALKCAVDRNSSAAFEFLLGLEESVVEELFRVDEFYRVKMIHTACHKGNDFMAHVLLARGVDPNGGNATITPLWLAAHGGYASIVQMLLEMEADPLRSNRGGESPLHVACEQNYPEVVELLLTTGYVNQIDTKSRNALYVACQHGRIDIVHLLLNNGANPNQRNQDGDTALHAATAHGHHNIVEILTGLMERSDSSDENSSGN